MRRLVVGDVHGGARALAQVLTRAEFAFGEDQLISLGDVCDGWPETRETVELLLAVKHLTFVRGNHDQWFIDFMQTGQTPEVWTTQGGQATLDSYRAYHPADVPLKHRLLFLRSEPFYETDGMAFVHGGFNPYFHPLEHDPEVLMWDRALIKTAYSTHLRNQAGVFNSPMLADRLGGWQKIFVGHTPVNHVNRQLRTLEDLVPQTWLNVVGMDTAGGWEGVLSVMDVDTGEHWQSDLVSSLYPGFRHR